MTLSCVKLIKNKNKQQTKTNYPSVWVYVCPLMMVVSHSLELELPASVSHLMQVLGTEL